MTPTERAQLYAFFSRLWVKEVDEAFLEALRGPLGREVLPQWALDEVGPSTPLRVNAQSSFGTPVQARTDLPVHPEPVEGRTSLDADFVHLTVVNLAPYESFFVREDGMVEAGAVNPVAEFFKKYGFEADLAAARALAPDHLGIELEFLSVLCAKEAEAVEAGNAPYAGVVRGVQRAFLTTHLLAWAPMYLFAAKRNAHTALYREGAEATLQYLLGDLEALS